MLNPVFFFQGENDCLILVRKSTQDTQKPSIQNIEKNDFTVLSFFYDTKYTCFKRFDCFQLIFCDLKWEERRIMQRNRKRDLAKRPRNSQRQNSARNYWEMVSNLIKYDRIKITTFQSIFSMLF